MRLESFEIRNYKGIALARLDDMAKESVVTISGRNGTGKSLLLEALVGAWSQRYQMNLRVGPWGDELGIRMTVHLSEDEWASVDAWHQKVHGSPAARSDELNFELRATATSNSVVKDSQVMTILRSSAFQRDHRFGIIDFLPANRLVPSVPTPTVDLGMLGVERVEQERFSMLDQFINNRAPMTLPSVSNYLVTLDYQAFLADRQGIVVDNDYALLAASFNSSTGKTLLQPEYDPAKGSNIEIQLPTGQRHGLVDLSSGEQEMLAMMYFVRRLSASGGILCIDEPEQHLHPTLQAALFDAMQGLAERAQVLVVSHSVNLITAAPLSGLVQVGPPVDNQTDQVQRLTDHPGKLELVANLGLTPADLFQSDMLLVVEGDTDAQWLRALFPVEMGRAHIMVAGSAGQVIDAHETLTKFSGGLPWLCIRDRDLMSDVDVHELQSRYPNVYVWPQRAIESLFLNGALIAATMNAVGQATTIEEVNGWLEETARGLQEEVLAQLVDKELVRQFPPPAAVKSGTRYEKMETHLRNYATVNTSRADAMHKTVEEQRVALQRRWASERSKLVDPKPMMAQAAVRASLFKSQAALMSALVARAREDITVRPAGLEALRAKVAVLLVANGAT